MNLAKSDRSVCMCPGWIVWRAASPTGVWNLKKCPGIRAATRAAPTKSGFLICNLPGFYVFVVRATLVVAHISKVPDTNGQALSRYISATI